MSRNFEDFLVASLIERCPKTMMIRELIMNANTPRKNTERDNAAGDDIALRWLNPSSKYLLTPPT
jgi:hypothetical protein